MVQIQKQNTNSPKNLYVLVDEKHGIYLKDLSLEDASEERMFANQKVDGEYTQADLKFAFTKVQNKEHWKNPIDAIIKMEEQDITERAIIFYTGSIPSFAPKAGGMLRVIADGYYVAIGA